MFLNCHSWFSFLYGTLSPEKLLEQAKKHGIERFVLTDINNTSACLEITRLSKKLNIEVILGIDFRNQLQQQFIGISRNQDGFEKLNRLLSIHLKSEQPFADKCEIREDVLIIYPFNSTKNYELDENEFIGINYKDLHYLNLKKWNQYHDKLVVLHPVSLNNKDDYHLHKILRAIAVNTILSKIKTQDLACADEFFLDESAFINHYQAYPKIIENTSNLLDKCKIIDFGFNQQKNKSIIDTHPDQEIARENDYKTLEKLAYDGAKVRYKIITQKVKDRLEKELRLIRSQKFVPYFLINFDIVSFARKKGFFYIGRGSGANSVVAYCLRITDVDPIELDLYFERFINVYRKNPPDFDIDFSWQDRNEVIQYIFNKYGLEHVCLQATYTTFQANSVFRELGKVYGLPTQEIELLAERGRQGIVAFADEKLYLEINLFAKALLNFPKNLSIHAGGILISDQPIFKYTATSHPPKGFPICQFDMHEAEDLGLYKFDILSQRGLGHIKDTLTIVKQNQGITIDIHDIPKFMKDERIVKHLEKANLIGCFYVESPAMRMLLAKLQCKDYLTLVAASSIIRPGVAQSGMMREYILRHHSADKGKSIAHPILWDLMEDTYGVMVYQEDVIKVAHLFAGLDLGEADVLRRGMSGKFRSRAEFLKVQASFFENCVKKGHPEVLAKEVWRQIESFAGYSFAKGHSASFAVESYQSMYLKAYFPLEFMVGVINNFGGFYRTEIYVHEARKNGAIIGAPCINNSIYLTSIKEISIHLGFIHVDSLGQKLTEAFLLERNNNGFYEDLPDFINRVEVSLEQLIILIRIGAFRFTGKSKQMLLWEAHFILNKQPKKVIHQSLFKYKQQQNFDIPQLHYDKRNDLLDEMEILGFSLSSPFKLLANQNLKGIKASEIPQYLGKEVDIMGYLVTTKYAKTKHGQIMFFGTFLDEDGDWIDTVLFPDIASRFNFKGNGCYLIKGKVSLEFAFYTLEVTYLERLGWWNAGD
jgi:DNA-directed DNA polymerase III PolC